jgi:hypothetical protein
MPGVIVDVPAITGEVARANETDLKGFPLIRVWFDPIINLVRNEFLNAAYKLGRNRRQMLDHVIVLAILPRG